MSVPSDPRGGVAAELVDVEKSFGGLKALDGVTLQLRHGEIHVVLGENGAGKTTLMRVLAGSLRPDAGQVLVHGRQVSLSDRREGARLGVGYVQQNLSLVDELTGAENLLLGHPHGRQFLDLGEAARQLGEAARHLGVAVDPTRPAGLMPIGERQRLEILIALAWGADILILDEPTAALSPVDFESLHQVLERLAGEGKAIVYITHRLAEVSALADRVTVMRRGKVVSSHGSSTSQFEPERLVREMIGVVPRRLSPHRSDAGDAVIGLHAAYTGDGRRRADLKGVDLVVRRGEVVGVAGVVGNGQDELAQVLAGLLKPAEGEIRPRPSVCAYLPENRGRDGVALDLSVADNLIVHAHRDFETAGGLRFSKRAINSFVNGVVDEYQIRLPSTSAPIRTLSGGNQQRVVVGRELARSPDLVVAQNPCTGLDVGATFEVRQRLLLARDAGAAVVLISPDLDELFEVSDRIVVLFEGRVVGSLEASEYDPQEVGRLMAGAS